MLKKSLIMFIVICLFLTGCTAATDNVYSTVETLKWVSDPNYVAPESSEEVVSSEDDFTSNNTTTNSSSETKEKPKVLYVKDFGAKADGKTDDGKAIMDAVFALGTAPAGSKLIFESNKTYFMSNNNISKAAFYLAEISDYTIEGNNTTILVDKGNTYLVMSECTNITVKGFNFDLKQRAHFVGTVVEKNTEEKYFDVVSDRDFGFAGEYSPKGEEFGFRNIGTVTSRSYLCIKKISTLDEKTLKYRIYADVDEGKLGTSGQFKAMTVGEKIVLPVPEIGFVESHMLTVNCNTNITFKDINIWNAPYFVWILRNNLEKISFENVNVMPAPDEKICFSSWRDAYHTKSNSAQFIWKNCTIKGNGDDTLNLSANLMYVDSVISKNEITCYWPETKGAPYENPEIGSDIIIWDTDTGELIGKTKLKKVVDKKTNRYILADKLPKLRAGENVLFCFDNHACPNAQIIDCNIDGTFRFRGGPVTVENSDIRVIKTWIECEAPYEGPIPHDISFNNCRFTASKDSFIITVDNPMVLWKEGLYRLENISFNNCTGLKKEQFSDLNLEPKSTDYIKFNPALTE